MSLFIGTSLGKGVKDILDGKVQEDEVFVIVTNTMCPDLPRLMDVIETYYYERTYIPEYDMSAHTLEDAKAVAQRLFESGKLHQPRVVMNASWGNAHGLKDTWYDIIPSAGLGNLTDNDNVRDAFDRYRALSILLT